MPAWLLTATRTAVQTGWGYLAAWLLSLGVNAPADAPAWLTGVAVALVTLAVTALIRWLETRPATSLLGQVARRLGQLFMLGLSYAPTATS